MNWRIKIVIVDTHTHIGETIGFLNVNNSIDAFLSKMNQVHIDYAINAPVVSMMQHGFSDAITLSKRLFEQSQGKIMSYFVFEPQYTAECIRLIEQNQHHSNIFKGIKIHPAFHQTDADDDAYLPIFQLANRLKLPILSHSWDVSDYNHSQKHSFPDKFIRYIEEFPNVNLILGHSGGRHHGIISAKKLAQKYQNVYLDLAGDIYFCGLVDSLIASCSSKKILFGTDMNWFEPSPQLGMVLSSKMSSLEKKDILYDNAIKLFNI